MSKKLKRRIQDLCGFNDLSDRSERIERAYQILNSAELKQSICLKILGTTFKDVEKAMEGILKERQITEEQREILEEEFIPEKFDPEVTFLANKDAADIKKTSGYSTYSREDVNRLMAASKAPPKQIETPEKRDYPIMSREECERLMKEHYEYLEEKSKKKEQEPEWDSQKMTGFELKTKKQTKPTNSTKASKA